MCATARRIPDNLLREYRLARIQSLSYSCHILRDCMVTQTDCAWDDLWNEPVED